MEELYEDLKTFRRKLEEVQSSIDAKTDTYAALQNRYGLRFSTCPTSKTSPTPYVIEVFGPSCARGANVIHLVWERSCRVRCALNTPGSI